jgi:hypothetical protein
MAMASILTPEDVVRRIAAECTFIDERGAHRHSTADRFTHYEIRTWPTRLSL